MNNEELDLVILNKIFEKFSKSELNESAMKRALAEAFYAGKKSGIDETKTQIKKVLNI